MRWVTLDVGEQALIYDINGVARVEEGPKRLFLFREKFELLRRYSANQNQYMVIVHRNGNVQHAQGPYVTFLNPLEHCKIQVLDLTPLDANEAVVVYQEDEATGEVKRFVLYGPMLFMPSANEWLHEFAWHGCEEGEKTRMIPGHSRFKKLQIIPDQFYYNIDEVRTSDDALLKVKMMLFYELRDIEKMLNATQDPIGDFINCLCADVVAYASKKTYVEFIEKSAELNNLENFPNLRSRCETIGYDVSKVVFRGHVAHAALQRMHDAAIEKRTDLKVSFERVEQEQCLTDRKLQSERQRMQQEQRLELETLKHEQELARSQAQHRLQLQRLEWDNRLDKLKQEKSARLAGKIAEALQELEHYKKLHALGVDLNQVIEAKANRPVKVTRVVAKKESANLHLHYS